MDLTPTLSCNCSGIRSCLICQKNEKVENNTVKSPSQTFWFCPSCGKIYGGCIKLPLSNSPEEYPLNWCVFHLNCTPSQMILKGIYVAQGFVSATEESVLVNGIDAQEWKLSQSGRRKQDFGPKANFKRRKVKLGGFNGFPSYSQFLIQRLSTIHTLTQFSPVELCNLEYTCERGSSIDPHIDDTWLWGEELVTLNLLDTTILTLSKPCNDGDEQLRLSEVQIPLERRSLLVLSSEARHEWLHAIKRRDITNRRIAMTFRNLSQEILEDTNNSAIVQELRNISQSFSGTVVL